MNLWILTAAFAAIFTVKTASQVIYTQQSANTPPTILVDREWIVRDSEEVGTVVARVKADDGEHDVLIFGLELPGAYESNFATKIDRVPFIIDPQTGIVKVNESLTGKAGERFLLYVTASDGQLTAKSGILVKILAESSGKGSSFTPRPDALDQIQRLMPNWNGPVLPPRILPSSYTNRTQTKTYPEPVNSTIIDRTRLTPVVQPASETVRNATIINSREPSSKDSTFETILPVILTICGIFLTAAMIAIVIFRDTLCTISRQLKQKSKIEKAKNSNQSQISNISSTITEDSRNSMVMRHWTGPLAASNRYLSDWGSQLSNGTSVSQSSDIKMKDRWEFPRHRIKVFNILGEGAFGQVWRCEAQDIDGNEGVTTVAVKTLKDNANESERNDLLSELAVMKTLEPHINVVRLLGCCTEKDPIFVILEYVSLGKLQTYLRNSRSEKHYGNYNNTHGKSKTLTSGDLTAFMYQVARGMDYLTSRGIIHRDLAARNILIAEDHTCKVADFGFARDIITSKVYERKSEGRLPIRWMAPESLYDNIFSVKSDIWSFGVLMWEIVTLGSTPYPGISASDVMRKVREGHRLEKPEHCRRELYNIMYYCWAKDSNDRPTFGELVSMLDKLLVTEMDYIELERFPDHNYYNMLNQSGEKL